MNKPRFFFTTNYPHKWGTGPVLQYHDPKTWEPIRDMEHARELAKTQEKGNPGEAEYCETSYGVVYPTRGIQS